MNENTTCEAIEAVFSYGPQRCMKPAVGHDIDAKWGTIHPVCEEHLPSDDPTAPAREALRDAGWYGRADLTDAQLDGIVNALADAGLLAKENDQ